MMKITGCSSGGPQFNSQHPYCGSQLSIMGSDALYWHVGIHADKAFIHLKKYTNVGDLLSLRTSEGLLTWFLICSELERTKRCSCQKKNFSFSFVFS